MYKRRTKRRTSRKNRTRRNRHNKGGSQYIGLVGKVNDTDAYKFVKKLLPNPNTIKLLVLIDRHIKYENEKYKQFKASDRYGGSLVMIDENEKTATIYYYEKSNEMQEIKKFTDEAGKGNYLIYKPSPPEVTPALPLLPPPPPPEEVESIPMKMPEIVQTPNPKKRPLSP